MVDLYFWETPNSMKVLMTLIETNCEYNIVPINIYKREHMTQNYKKINPNHKLPAIIDHKPKYVDDPVSLYESNAILMYLADKKKALLPKSMPLSRFECLKWLSWQNSNFVDAIKEKNDETIKYNYQILEDHLRDKRFLCGDEYSIADISLFPWVDQYNNHQININNFPHTKEWYYRVFDRDATKKSKDVAKHFTKDATFSDESREFLMKNDPDKSLSTE